MLLSKLLSPWLRYVGADNVKGLSLDSRLVEKGDLFIAIGGNVTNGEKFIEDAFINGAEAALVSTTDEAMHGKFYIHNKYTKNCIYFYHLERYVSFIAKAFYLPDLDINSKQKLIGVTGTNGKTSICHLIAQLSSKKVALMGTLGNGIWPNLETQLNTTADSVTIWKLISKFFNSADICVLEVSSHGLIQDRVTALPFASGIFTNLTRDHLDYHITMENYEQAKKSLFLDFNLTNAIINIDDEVGERWLKDGIKSAYSYSIKTKADFYAYDIKFTHLGISAKFVWPKGEGIINSPLLGAFNLSNLIAALATLYLQGESMDMLLNLTKNLSAVVGRMECFYSDSSTLVVDYAHTPDALEKALQTLKEHCVGDIWCIFGCGGNRDKGKRPLMGEIASKYAQHVVLTNDNSRFEDPREIINDIKSGIKDKEIMVIIDRACAIETVIKQAKPHDIVLIAGKGHETYQEINGIKHDYNERELVRKLSKAE